MPLRYEDHNPSFLTDLHDPQNPTWWQSETMLEGIQHPNHVNLTLHLRKSSKLARKFEVELM